MMRRLFWFVLGAVCGAAAYARVRALLGEAREAMTVRNVLAAGKGIGVTHITNGCYRMHHTEWNIGESAGLLAAHCVETGLEPQAVHGDPVRVEDFQRELAAQGVRLAWPWE